MKRRSSRSLALAALLVLAMAGRARADSWQLTDFESPAGKPARGLVTDSSGEPRARLVIGCESATADGWRGVAIRQDAAATVSVAKAEVVISFFGRAPVTQQWQARTAAGQLVLWPESGESVRRDLLREDSTRGEAAVTFEVRSDGRAPQKLVFALEGLSERSSELAAACGGWGSATPAKRRERNW